MEKICCIVGAMPSGDLLYAAKSSDLVIAADGGLRYLEEQDIQPDYVVGDFDSLGRVPAGKNIIRHPVEKDDTDMLLAVRTGLAEGCQKFLLFGGLGGRLDHTYANLQVLGFLAERGAQGWLLGDGTVITAVHNGTLEFPAECSGTISVFCAGADASGVTLRGLYYPLEDAVLKSSVPLGVSNQFTGVSASVSVSSGTLLVMWQQPAEEIIRQLLH
ncbi:MAG: thiamine diphosphokinase [Oscillospiraceae bacterium]|nr:thiamine diphosphokinase [Oscillospiraceae bacterium]